MYTVEKKAMAKSEKIKKKKKSYLPPYPIFLEHISCPPPSPIAVPSPGLELNIESIPRNGKTCQAAPAMVGYNLEKFWKFDPSRCSKTAFPVHFPKHYYVFGEKKYASIRYKKQQSFVYPTSNILFSERYFQTFLRIVFS